MLGRKINISVTLITDKVKKILTVTYTIFLSFITGTFNIWSKLSLET